jgi:nucleoid-associated protein YgaU
MVKATKKAVVKKDKLTNVEESEKKGTKFSDYLRFGESYTSLILGIIVVIVATALLLSFVHNKDAGNVNTPISQQTQNTFQISQKVSNLAQKAPNTATENEVTPKPTDTIAPTAVPTAVPKPTAKPTERPTSHPIAKTTQKSITHPTTKPTEVVKKIVIAKPKPTVKPTSKPQPTFVKKKIAKATPTPQKVIKVTSKNIWVVQKNESLWIIAEKKYTSGYNWVDIAKANNLADPSDIHVGDRLVLPNVTPGPSTIASSRPTVTTNDEQFSSTKQTYTANAITGTTYTVVHGDTLWDISVRAYGDGYKWLDIAKANNLTNPGMIFSGNVLTIPRG